MQISILTVLIFKTTYTLKTSVTYFFAITLQLHNSPGDWAKELFKPSRCGDSSGLDKKKIRKFCISSFLWYRDFR